eukprot:CAMPEP_0172869392 /NCGR_PEP_ID=MMETSP1075-20121228/88907_1 /TAXON_ID=2916 /ORGANISM="Ceratium fusus, Strain PA161109" /LENGTH=429 /DNA_ID=CAMNT_0013719283 /DNA_START=123 /DNA_END=1409 /DNA_ORIENTATION=-
MAAAKGHVGVKESAEKRQATGKDAVAPMDVDDQSCSELAVPADKNNGMMEERSTSSAKLEKEAPRRHERLPLGIVFTLGAPSAWDISDFYSVITRHKIRAVLDMRPSQETGPTSERIHVACSAYGVDYERHRVLTDAYVKLVAKARGEAGDALRPCILLGGTVGWRLLQTRRCISRYMDVKNLVVQHLAWSGDIDEATGMECKRDAKRSDFKYPKAPPLGHKAKARPTEGPPAKASSNAAPVMPSRAKSAPPSASASSTVAPVMQARPKGGSSVPTSEQRAKAEATTSASQPDTVLKSKPKASAAGDAASQTSANQGNTTATDDKETMWSLLLNQPDSSSEQPARVQATKPAPSAKIGAAAKVATPKLSAAKVTAPTPSAAKVAPPKPMPTKAAPKPKQAAVLPSARPKPTSAAGSLIKSLLESDTKRR